MGVVQHALGRWVDPVDAWCALLADEPDAFWLDSNSGTGVSYLGAGTPTSTLPSTPLAGIGDGFELGWVGWIPYEYRGVTMGEPVPSPGEPMLIDADWALAFDHSAGTVHVLVQEAGRVAGIVAALDAVRERRRVGVASGAIATWAHDDATYLDLVRACQAAIVEGDAYQLCLTTSAEVPGVFDPLDTYLALRATSPSHHGGLIVSGDTALLSASPELFLSVSSDGLVSSKPIKGTRGRSHEPVADAALAKELVESEKERAENLMIVDLMRNDIGRVSVVGSVMVPSLLQVESYANVHQLVSAVTGRLADGLTATDAVTATFPAGSMTGAPKLSATRILATLEARPRGIYSGAFGYFSRNGSIDLAMVIRSIVIEPGRATVGAGGGITALSVAEEELAEVKLKAEPLLRVLGVV